MRKLDPRRGIAVLLLLLATPALAWAQASGGSDEAMSKAEVLAREMIQVTGGAELGKQMIEQLVGSFKATNPAVPGEFWDEFVAEVDTQGLEDLVVPVYVENLTIEEMEAAVEFYNSPEGRSLISKMPTILQQSMTLGQQWGQELGRRAAERLERFEQQNPETR